MDNRRKQYLVDKGFQKKTIFRLMLLVVGTVLAAHLVATGYLKLMQEPKISAGFNMFSTTVHNSVETANFFGDLWLPVLITCLLGILFVLGFGLIYSHRIAGPLFNLKRVLQKIGQGDLETAMHIRAADEFHDVEDVFNLMAKELTQRHQTLRQALEELPPADKRKLLKIYDDLFHGARLQTESVKAEPAI